MKGTLSVACKCFCVFMTLLGPENLYGIRSVSQTRIFWKHYRYTVSQVVSLEKVKHWGKVQNPRFGIQNPETFPAVSGASTRVPGAVRWVGCSKLIGITIGWDFGLRYRQNWNKNQENQKWFQWKSKIYEKLFFGAFHSVSGTRACRPKCLAGRRLRNVFWLAHLPQIL